MRYIVTILGIFLGDEWLKKYIEDHKEVGKYEDILDGKITVTRHHNKGAMLNFMQDKPKWVLGFSGAGMGAVLVFAVETIFKDADCVLKWGAALLAGGGLSNLFDRIQKGYVVDYFIINKGKLKKVIFNLSDILIFIGGLMIFIGSLFKNKGK